MGKGNTITKLLKKEKSTDTPGREMKRSKDLLAGRSCITNSTAVKIIYRAPIFQPVSRESNVLQGIKHTVL